MTRERASVGLAILAAAIVLSFRTVYEPDLWWHLAQGRENAAGRFVGTNVFSFAYPEYRQHFTSWLFDTLGYAAWQVGGATAIQTAQALLLSVALGLVYLACRLRAPGAAAFAVLSLGVVVLEPRALPRPYLVSFAGMALCAVLIERARVRRSADPLRWAIPAVAIWSNVHVESVFGVALLGIFAIGEFARPGALTRVEARRALVFATASAAATLATPYGWGLWRYLYENVSLPRVLNIVEVQPPSLPNSRAFFAYVAVAAILLASQPRRLRLWEGLAAGLFAALGLRYTRLTPLVFLVTAPMLADRLGRAVARGLDGRAVVVTALVVSALASRLPLSVFIRGLRTGDEAVAPALFFSAPAMAFARSHGLGGPVFNSNNLGGYLAWTLYPQTRVFQDGRLQAYPPQHFAAILMSARSQGDWDTLMTGLDWAVLSSPRPNTLSGAGRFPRAQWATVFWDEAVGILVRRTGAHARLLPDREYQHVTSDVDPVAVAQTLPTATGDRIRREARRNMAENPDGFVAAAILCLAGTADACGTAERVGRRPGRQDDLERLQAARFGQQ